MANTCPVCGGKLGLLNREKSADGLICASCSNFFYSKLGFPGQQSSQQPPLRTTGLHWNSVGRCSKKPIPSMMVTRSLCPLTKPTGCFVLGTAAVIKALA